MCVCAEGRGKGKVLYVHVYMYVRSWGGGGGGGGGGGQLAGGCGREESIAESLSIRLVLTGGTCTCI